MPPTRRRLPTALQRAVDRLRMRFGVQDAANERRIKPVIERWMLQFLQAVRRALLGGNADAEPDLGRFPNPQAWQEDLAEALLPELGQVFSQGWARVPDAPDNPEPYRTAYLAAIRNRLTKFPDDVYDDLREELALGLDAGEDVRQLRDRVKATLDHEEAMTDYEATRIARTEVHGAVNGGTYAAAQAHMSRTGERQRKLWIATADDRTRPTHRKADRQQVGLEEPFEVGGGRLMFPGDPSGPAREVINCRCSMVVFGSLTADILNRVAPDVLGTDGGNP